MAEGIYCVNNGMVGISEIPCMPPKEFQTRIIEECTLGKRVSSLFGSHSEPSSDKIIHCVLSNDQEGRLEILSTKLKADGTLESMTKSLPQVHLFERELFEEDGIRISGHPFLNPLRFVTNSSEKNYSQIGKMPFYRVEGSDIHEVAVGPVHAGIIEPGHFRFQCFGEKVFNLEISLGYQHRGIERKLRGGPEKRSFHYIETVSGDSTIAHASAYCQIIENLSQMQIPVRAMAIRGIALELERIACHVGDLGALANDVGFLPTAAYCGRIRGDFLNMTAAICGNRFGRGLLCPGGVNHDIPGDLAKELMYKISIVFDELVSAVDLLWNIGSVVVRFEDIGTVKVEDAKKLGLVGVAARACGLVMDVRQDHPTEIFCYNHIPISIWQSGDVFARAYVRWLEIKRSVKFIKQQLEILPGGSISKTPGTMKPDSMCVALSEGWRGEVCHTAITGPDGRFKRYKIVDPSFHNWTGLSIAVRDQQISDFPLCNKSFNLSYCGHDL
ncbi:MAG: NADH-quinone oxidoreductase subunit C [Oligoflexales bacterium]|nr:NADH-quinone oxidoreductase subunit C [Oligoflexales bacterium]